MPARPNFARDLALLLLLSVLWGASYSFIRLAVQTIPPFTLIAARTVIAGLVLLAVARSRGIPLPCSPVVWRQFLVQACLNSALPFTLIAWAETRINAGTATILNSTTPIFTFLLLTLAPRGKQPGGALKLAGVICGLAGTCLVVGVEAMQGVGEQLTAQLAVVTATACYAGAAIFGRNFKSLNPILPAAGSLVCGAALLVPASLVVDRPWTLSPSLASIAALLALSIVSTALAFVVYFRLLQTLGSVGTTAQAYLRVPIGVGIGMLLLSEAPSPTVWAGMLLVVAGVAAMTLPARQSRSIASPAAAHPLKPGA